MISYRSADLYKKLKPIGNPDDPKVGDVVYVHPPTDIDEEWPAPFLGKVIEIQPYNDGVIYQVENPKEPTMEPWAMGRGSFDFGPANIGDIVNVYDPDQAMDDWSEPFQGTITGKDKDHYYVTDQEDVAFVMSREKFGVKQ